MVKNITTILFNSTSAGKEAGALGTNNNLSYSMDVPPIEIRGKAVMKVANFCHNGTASGHNENIYFFRVKGVSVDNSKFISNTGGYPILLANTFNNNRSLYEENEITLIKQTINYIEIPVDTLNSSGIYSYGINSNLNFCMTLRIEEEQYE